MRTIERLILATAMTGVALLPGSAARAQDEPYPKLTTSIEVGDKDFGGESSIDALAGTVICPSIARRARTGITSIYATDPDGNLTVTTAVEGIKLTQLEFGLRPNGTSFLGVTIDRGLTPGLYNMDINTVATSDDGTEYPCRTLGLTVYRK